MGIKVGLSKIFMELLHKLFNFLPSFRGKYRIAKFLIFDKKSECQFVTKRGNTFICPNLSETVSFELFVSGVYEKSTIEI
jgi:hypothetical protein